MPGRAKEPPSGRQVAGVALLGAVLTAVVAWAVSLPWWLITACALAQAGLLTWPAISARRAARP